jgi:hypothetical protein
MHQSHREPEGGEDVVTGCITQSAEEEEEEEEERLSWESLSFTTAVEEDMTATMGVIVSLSCERVSE